MNPFGRSAQSKGGGQELRVSCSPSPRPSPYGRGRNIRPRLCNSTQLRCSCASKDKEAGTAPAISEFSGVVARSLPLPWGEGWGEGERSNLQSQAHDACRNCQTSRVLGRGLVTEICNLSVSVTLWLTCPVWT